MFGAQRVNQIGCVGKLFFRRGVRGVMEEEGGEWFARRRGGAEEEMGVSKACPEPVEGARRIYRLSAIIRYRLCDECFGAFKDGPASCP